MDDAKGQLHHSIPVYGVRFLERDFSGGQPPGAFFYPSTSETPMMRRFDHNCPDSILRRLMR
ncbi:hypothetical protein GA0061094_2657 [[Bacillus] enclensis]|uniref:Uncharacterized protein n=1 Tax=[Bacillus] enclensis TaxID=1402860 RepID=A0A1C4C5D0_9BACI|nr:hypothetical protein GA0061094_2657 [[Bacillus] enclensis]